MEFIKYLKNISMVNNYVTAIVAESVTSALNNNNIEDDHEKERLGFTRCDNWHPLDKRKFTPK